MNRTLFQMRSIRSWCVRRHPKKRTSPEARGRMTLKCWCFYTRSSALGIMVPRRHIDTSDLFRRGDRTFFVHGFAKSHQANIRPDERKASQALADTLFGLQEAEVAAAMANGTIREVPYHGEAIQE